MTSMTSMTDDESTRSLQDVGAVAVLGAMLEQRLHSRSLDAFELARRLDRGHAFEQAASQHRKAIDGLSESFMKIR